MRYLLTILLGLNLVTSCKSTDEDASHVTEATQDANASIAPEQPKVDAAKPSVEDVVKRPEKICTMEYNPTRCYYTEYKGEEITENSRIFGWGLNPCSAKNSLEDEARKLTLDPALFSEPTCSPDVSQGTCSEVFQECKPDETGTPAVCKVTGLSGKNFRDDEIIQTLGNKLCDAKTLAKLELCKRNLFRKDLSIEIQCVQAPESLLTCANEKFETCPNTYSPKICELMLPAELSSATRQLSFARNECLARKILERRVCFMSSGVDIQQKVICRSPD